MTEQELGRTIELTGEDMQRVMAADPLIALQVKCMALIRMLEERDIELVQLRAQLEEQSGNEH